MIGGRLVHQLLTALARPWQRPDIDHDARREIERRQREIAARIAGARQDEARAMLLRRRARGADGR